MILLDLCKHRWLDDSFFYRRGSLAATLCLILKEVSLEPNAIEKVLFVLETLVLLPLF